MPQYGAPGFGVLRRPYSWPTCIGTKISVEHCSNHRDFVDEDDAAPLQSASGSNAEQLEWIRDPVLGTAARLAGRSFCISCKTLRPAHWLFAPTLQGYFQ